jgi:hypothetical protein
MREREREREREGGRGEWFLVYERRRGERGRRNRFLPVWGSTSASLFLKLATDSAFESIALWRVGMRGIEDEEWERRRYHNLGENRAQDGKISG